MIAFFFAGHLGELIAVVAESLILGGGRELGRVDEDEVAVFGVAACLVAFDAGFEAYFEPDFVGEVFVHGGGAGGAGVGFFCGDCASGEEQDEDGGGADGHGVFDIGCHLCIARAVGKV